MGQQRMARRSCVDKAVDNEGTKPVADEVKASLEEVRSKVLSVIGAAADALLVGSSPQAADALQLAQAWATVNVNPVPPPNSGGLY